MPQLKIDFVSDIACPWCAIGFAALRRAARRLEAAVEVVIVPRAFELNPDMPPEGENVVDYVQRRYGAPIERIAADRRRLVARAAEEGFEMAMTSDSRMNNTFAAHRLIHWARQYGRDVALKQALFDANFTRNEDVALASVLGDVAASAGLDRSEALLVVGSDRYAEEVRIEEAEWARIGVRSVPTTIVSGQLLVAGGETANVFEKAILERVRIQTAHV